MMAGFQLTTASSRDCIAGPLSVDATISLRGPTPAANARQRRSRYGPPAGYLREIVTQGWWMRRPQIEELRIQRYFDTVIGPELQQTRQRKSFAAYALSLLGEGDRKSCEPIAARFA